jgi:hypothetical protein
VKDMDKVNPDWNAEIGTGSIDFKSSSRTSRNETFLFRTRIKHKPNPIESAITSFNYISKSLNRN